MRISPVFFLLPVLVLSGACTQTVPSAKANDDRPVSPQPAIASPVTAPLTIEALAGTYKAVVDEKALKKVTNDIKQQIGRLPKRDASVPVKILEQLDRDLRQFYEQASITINSDGTFESRINFEQRGKIKLDGNKLIFTADSSKPLDGTNGSSNTSKCNDCCTFTLKVSTDRKTLLLDEPSNSSQLWRGYVKQ